MKETYYFRHDYNARNDEKCAVLIARHGYEGYGIFWALVEAMHEHTTGMLQTKFLDGLAHMIGCPKDKLEQVISTCLAVGLFVSEGEAITSDRVLDQKQYFADIKAKRAEAGRRGGMSKARKLDVANAKQEPSKDEANSTKGKERKVKESKEQNIRMAADAAPPSKVLSEIDTFAQWLNASQIFPGPKVVTDKARQKWAARRKKYSARELAQAFANLSNEPDGWKIKHNGGRPLAWWLDSDDRIEDMKSCHLKGSKGSMLFAG